MNFLSRIAVVMAILALVIDGQKKPGRTPSPTPMPTKGVRTKTTRMKGTKTPRVRVKTTTAPPMRTKAARPGKGKGSKGRTKGTPSPTPMPTEECDCYTTTLVAQQIIGGNKCYKYMVDFCKPGMNSVILGDGNADKNCGINDVMDIITNVRLPPGVTYDSTYTPRRDAAGKVRGIKIDGLMSGDAFRICFDKDVVGVGIGSGVEKGGYIEYQSYYGDVSCKQSGTLPELCPMTVSNAAMGGKGRVMRTPSPTPNPTKGVRVKTTRAKGMKTTRPRMRSKTTKAPPMRSKTTRYRAKGKGTPMPTPMPTEQCDCVSTELVSRNVIGSNKCYRYEVDFCNDGINSITLGDGNADNECGVDFMDEMTELDVPDGVTYSAVYNDKVRGLKLTGLVSGDKFRVCYDKNVVDSTIKAGFIEYYTDSGEFSCKQSNNLPDLCPLVVSNAGSGGAGKTDPCSCNKVTLTGSPYSAGESCYRYQVNFCNENYDTIEMGMGSPEDLCDTKIKQVFTSYKPPSLNIQVGRPFGGDEAKARGIAITDLSDGDMFTLCFDRNMVYDVREHGTIDFLNPRGKEETCNVVDTLFDLCPLVDPPFPAQQDSVQFIDEAAGKIAANGSMTMMTILWAAFVSIIVSMTVVAIGYFVCIKPSTKTHVYDKVDEKDLI